MKKISKLTLLISVLLLTACGSGEVEKVEGSVTQTNEVEKPETKGAEQAVESEVSEVKQEPKEEPKALVASIGEPIVIEDYAEIVVKANQFGKVINPPSPASFYSYYENKETDEIYLDTVISVKSLLTSKKSSDEFLSVKVVYDDKYEYQTFSTIEEDGGSDFTYTNITSIEPLKTGVLHYLASVPESFEIDDKPLKVLITIKGDTYEQIIR